MYYRAIMLTFFSNVIRKEFRHSNLIDAIRKKQKQSKHVYVLTRTVIFFNVTVKARKHVGCKFTLSNNSQCHANNIRVFTPIVFD